MRRLERKNVCRRQGEGGVTERLRIFASVRRKELFMQSRYEEKSVFSVVVVVSGKLS